MTIWVLADLHLSLSVPEKNMDVFGPAWENYTERIKRNWEACVEKEDLVLIPGDICWARNLQEAMTDLEWIDALPGTKLLLKGNHDYWWASNKKMEEHLPSSIHFIHNTVFEWENVSIGGTRLWDTDEYNFDAIIEGTQNPYAKVKTADDRAKKIEIDRGIYEKELERLKRSLSKLSQKANLRIVMTHYPPLCYTLKESRVSKLLEAYHVDLCVFGHLHSVKKGIPLFGEKNGIRYILTSGDYLSFDPLMLVKTEDS